MQLDHICSKRPIRLERRWASSFLQQTTWELIIIFIIYRVMVTPVAGYLSVRADKAFAVQLDYLQLRHFQNS